MLIMISLSDFTGSSTVHNKDGMTTVRLGNLLDTQHWHYVTIKRYGQDLNFTLDSQTDRVQLNGEFNYLDLDNQVSSQGRTNQMAVDIFASFSLSRRSKFLSCDKQQEDKCSLGIATYKMGNTFQSNFNVLKISVGIDAGLKPLCGIFHTRV